MKYIFINLSLVVLLSTSLFANMSEMVFKGAVEVIIPFIVDGALKSDTQKTIDKNNAETSVDNFLDLFQTKKEMQPTHKTNIQEKDPCIF